MPKMINSSKKKTKNILNDLHSKDNIIRFVDQSINYQRVIKENYDKVIDLKECFDIMLKRTELQYLSDISYALVITLEMLRNAKS